MSFTPLLSGISSTGSRVLGGASLPVTTGNYIFVSNVSGANGSNGNQGNDPAYPKSTIAGAISAATANNGDIIVVLPGHAETVTGAAGIAFSKAGLTIIGVGSGSLRPTITLTTAIAAQVTVTGANTTIQNIVFTAGFDAITAMISVTAADVAFLGCEFNTNSGTVGAVLGILTAATATRFTVDSCRFLGPATNTGTTTTAQIQHEVGVDYRITNNYFTGKMTQAILNATTVLRGVISDNYAVVATGTLFVSVAAASTPFIVNNRINVPSGTTPIIAAAGFVAGNIYSAAAGVTSTGQTGSTATVSTI